MPVQACAGIALRYTVSLRVIRDGKVQFSEVNNPMRISSVFNVITSAESLSYISVLVLFGNVRDNGN